MSIEERLSALADPSFRDFQIKLLPTVAPESILGVRTPELRALARELRGSDEAGAFLSSLPHRYFDEYQLHGFIISDIRDFDAAMAETERFLPYIDNWATCDQTSPKVFGKRPDELFEKIKLWLRSKHIYTVRFGLGMIMEHLLDDSFRPDALELAATVDASEYYVSMMQAWLFATALAKQWDAALPFIEGRRLDTATHGRTIQKAVESRRIPDDRKELLRSMRIKKEK